MRKKVISTIAVTLATSSLFSMTTLANKWGDYAVYDPTTNEYYAINIYDYPGKTIEQFCAENGYELAWTCEESTEGQYYAHKARTGGKFNGGPGTEVYTDLSTYTTPTSTPVQNLGLAVAGTKLTGADYPYGASSFTTATGENYILAASKSGYSLCIFNGKVRLFEIQLVNSAGIPVMISDPALVNIDGKMYVDIKLQEPAKIYALDKQRVKLKLYGITGISVNNTVLDIF